MNITPGYMAQALELGSAYQTGLGRIPSANPKRLSAYALPMVKPTRRARHWLVPGGPDDQWSTPQCVAYACNHLLIAHPGPSRHVNRARLYGEAQRADYWQGGEYLGRDHPDYYEGTSVDAGLRVLRSWGLVHEYRWTTSVEVLAAHIIETGPAVVGTEWTEGMANPTPEGRIDATGASLGGHAYLLQYASLDRAEFGILNSWGQAWGLNGRARISFDAMQALLDAAGEAALVTKWGKS